MAITLDLRAPDIECEGCATSIRNVLSGLAGVQSVGVDVAGKKIRIEYDCGKINAGEIEKTLDEIGFPSLVQP